MKQTWWQCGELGVSFSSEPPNSNPGQSTLDFTLPKLRGEEPAVVDWTQWPIELGAGMLGTRSWDRWLIHWGCGNLLSSNRKHTQWSYLNTGKSSPSRLRTIQWFPISLMWKRLLQQSAGHQVWDPLVWAPSCLCVAHAPCSPFYRDY